MSGSSTAVGVSCFLLLHLAVAATVAVDAAAAGTDGIFRGLHRLYFHSMLSVLMPILLQTNCAAAAAAPPAAAAAAAATPAAAAAEQLQQQQQQQEQQTAALAISGAFEPLPLGSTMRHIATTAVRNSPTPNVL